LRNDIKTHELVTWSKRNFPLTEQEYQHIKDRMEAGAKFISTPNNTVIALNDIQLLGKRQISLSDLMTENNMLPEGERSFNPLGRGYIHFLAGGVQLALKGKTNLSKIRAKIKAEQIPLVNEELKRKGIEFQL
jgi:hypothetical protein